MSDKNEARDWLRKTSSRPVHSATNAVMYHDHEVIDLLTGYGATLRQQLDAAKLEQNQLRAALDKFNGIQPECGHERKFLDRPGDEFEECLECQRDSLLLERTGFREALVAQAVDTAYFNGQNGHRVDEHGEPVWKKYLCKEAKAFLNGSVRTIQSYQKRMVEWGIRCFGKDHMKDVRLRALRHLEESAEFAQAADVDRLQAADLIDYVFARPKGDPKQELGGVLVTAIVAADAMGLNAMDVLAQEAERVEAKPVKHFTARNEVKLEAGFK